MKSDEPEDVHKEPLVVALGLAIVAVGFLSWGVYVVTHGDKGGGILIIWGAGSGFLALGLGIGDRFRMPWWFD